MPFSGISLLKLPRGHLSKRQDCDGVRLRILEVYKSFRFPCLWSHCPRKEGWGCSCRKRALPFQSGIMAGTRSRSLQCPVAHFHTQPNSEGYFRFQSLYSLSHAENVSQLVLLYVMLFMRLTLVHKELDWDHQPISHGPMSSHRTVTTFDHNLRLGSNQLLNGDRFHATRLSLCVIQGPRLIKTTTRRKPFT